MEAVYDLFLSPANFNFTEFLVAAKTYGATGIVLDDTGGYMDKFNPDVTYERMESIVEPSCALAGLPFRYGPRESGQIDCGYHISAPLKAFNTCGKLEKLNTVKPAGTARYTVTIRNYGRRSRRNSDRHAWLRFADRIKAFVIEDWYDNPIHLHDRMALYAGAEMNFGTCGGPMSLCYFSDYPYTILMKNLDIGYMKSHGISCTGDFQWANKNQNCVWSSDDSYENILRLTDVA